MERFVFKLTVSSQRREAAVVRFDHSKGLIQLEVQQWADHLRPVLKRLLGKDFEERMANTVVYAHYGTWQAFEAAAQYLEGAGFTTELWRGHEDLPEVNVIPLASYAKA